MPDRIVRSSILSSETLATLSHPAERLFYRLMVLADDFGRFHAGPRYLRAAAMGLLDVSVANVGAWLHELQRAEVLCLYDVGGREYLTFRNWPRYQRLRAKESKFPAHSGCVCGQPPADADNGTHPQTSAPGIGIGIGIGDEEKMERARRSQETRLIGEWFDGTFVSEFPVHRRTTQAKSARRFVTEKLRPDEQKRSEIMRHLRAWIDSPEWKKDGGEYVPGLMRFFDKRCHEIMPIARAASSENNGRKRTGKLKLVDGRVVPIHPQARVEVSDKPDAMAMYEAPNGTIHVKAGAEWV